MTTFGQRLREAVRERGPLCVGIDPHPWLLEAWGLSDDPAGLERFSRTVVEALAGTVAALKPQSAFFERHGSAGVAVLEATIGRAREAGTLVIGDVKRGDIGSTAQAYADAYLASGSPLCCDAVTASPYLGFGTLRPMIDTALEHGNGVFVLAMTSNPEGGQVQRARGADGRTVAATMLDEVRAVNEQARRRGEWGSVGCVVGVTANAPVQDVDVGGPLLAPGLGAQGGTAADLPAVFGSAATMVLAASSREVLKAGPDASSLVAATSKAVESIREALAREDRAR